MKYAFEIRKIPQGTVLEGISVLFRQLSDGLTLAAATTDSDGFVRFEVDGHWPPFYLYVTGVTGGDKFWRSDEHHGAGPISLSDVPIALRALGDGVVRGHLNSLVPTLNTLTLSLNTGTALCAGYPVVNYIADTFSLTRPVSSTRIDRLVAWVRPLGAASAAGEAGFSVLTGSEGGAVTALTQTADLHEIGLAQITVPTAGALTLTDERLFAGEKEPESGVVRVPLFTTTSASGVLVTGAAITLDIPRPSTHDIIATVTAQQLESQVVTAWVLQATYGPTFNSLAISNPGQVAVDSTGRILIADTGNNRLVILTSAGAYSTGITGLAGITGVCVDSSDNIYVAYTNGIGKYNSALALQWVSVFGATSFKHIATDSTHFYIVFNGADKFQKRLCSTGAFVAEYGSSGTGNGQFNTPWGIAYDPGIGRLWIVDSGNSRVQRFNTVGTYIEQFPVDAGSRGIGVDPSTGYLFVAGHASNTVKHFDKAGTPDHTLFATFDQTTPSGIAVASGSVVWVSNATDGTIAKWDEASTPGGYGQLAIEIDSVVGTYTSIGNRDGAVANADTGTKTGGGTVVVRAFAKATASTLTLKGLVLSARAIPRR